MKNVEDIRTRANNYMKLAEPYEGETEVLHFLEVLRDRIGFDELKKKVVNPLTGKKIGAYYGCLLHRPGKIMAFDNPDSAAGFGAEMLITACPLCLYNLNKSGNGKLPVHYFTELLAEALGVKEEALQTLTSDKEVAE